MIYILFLLAAAVFIFGAITGALLTIAVGIHGHKHAHDSTRPPGAHLTATRQILGVGPLDDDQQRN